jgi:hypothetical protein
VTGGAGFGEGVGFGSNVKELWNISFMNNSADNLL